MATLASERSILDHICSNLDYILAGLSSPLCTRCACTLVCRRSPPGSCTVPCSPGSGRPVCWLKASFGRAATQKALRKMTEAVSPLPRKHGPRRLLRARMA